jgi:hypothetical protein
LISSMPGMGSFWQSATWDDLAAKAAGPFPTAIRDQLPHHENFAVTNIELEDDWKGISLQRVVASGDPLHASILAAAADLKALLHAAEVTLSGLAWNDRYLADEDAFCRELALPSTSSNGLSIREVYAWEERIREGFYVLRGHTFRPPPSLWPASQSRRRQRRREAFTENAREKVVEKMPKGCFGSVYFLDRERITELIERYWAR